VARRVGNVLVRVGGEGTPGVQDFCLGEIAVARSTGVTASVNALADALDLVHRLPATWAVVTSGAAEPWVARRVAKLSRHLPADCVHVVDAAVARIIAAESAGRVLEVAEAKVIEAAPGLHEQRLEEQRRRRFVALARGGEAGLRTVIARVSAGDAAWVMATVERVAQIIAADHPDLGADELRSQAFGWLARPAELLALLLEHTETPDPTDPTEPTDTPVTAEDEPEPSEPEEGPALTRALALPADLLEALRTADLSPLAPKAVLYVHLHEAALHSLHGLHAGGAGGAGGADWGEGVARVEGLGPMTLTQLRELLAHTRVSVTPVIDLADRVRTTAYEHPESLKQRVHLMTNGDYWPYATSTSRAVDYDHPTPYREPHESWTRERREQTGTHNSGPLGRRHHRWKTHAGYRARQSGQGRYAWLTPHGLGLLIDHTGTHRIPTDHATMIINAPPGIDIYPTPVRVQLDYSPRVVRHR
jgi:antitoxin (DNA-binding transcriptional repressor) of toxin-antitoxin stability system